jgi:hypothetical protein
VAAALMDHWFEGKPWPTEDGSMDPEVKRHEKYAPAQYIKESIVSMEWALKFAKVKAAISTLKANWNNSNAMVVIAMRLQNYYRESPPGCYYLKFNGSGATAERFKHFNTYSVEFGALNTDVDELRGALGDFNVRVIAEGVVVVNADSIDFFPERLGFYIDDSYDFSDSWFPVSQPLGFWNFNGLALGAGNALLTNAGIDGQAYAAQKASILSRGTSAEKKFYELEGQRYFLVQNDDFQNYRIKKNAGGDFKVYSNIYYMPIVTSSIKVGR